MYGAAHGHSDNLSGTLLNVYTFLTAGVGTINAFFLFFFFMTTLYSDTRGTIKNSEKILLYSVIVPDTVLTVFILTIVCPATYTDNWSYSDRTTTWLGYIFLVSIFHASLAMGSICNIIALSINFPQRYDSINKVRKMLILSMSYACLTCCLCCFPATEKKGLMYNPFWFSPTLTITEGFGGIFTSAANTCLSAYIVISSLNELQGTKKRWEKKKVPKKAHQDLFTSINFAGICLSFTLVLAVPMVIPVQNHLICLLLRLLVYASPVCRVLLLTRSCPHFQFVVDDQAEGDEMNEFVELSTLR